MLSQAESAHQVITPANIKLVQKIRIFQNREEVIGPESTGTQKHTHIPVQRNERIHILPNPRPHGYGYFLKMDRISIHMAFWLLYICVDM